ncbi:hypothetical protein P3L10_027952 [Capsicum annuum]
MGLTADLLRKTYDVLLSVGYSRVVRSGVPRGGGGRRNHALTGLSFLFIILGTATQGGANIASQVMRLVDPFRPWMQEDHVMIVILMTVVDFVANCLAYSIMMM